MCDFDAFFAFSFGLPANSLSLDDLKSNLSEEESVYDYLKKSFEDGTFEKKLHFSIKSSKMETNT